MNPHDLWIGDSVRLKKSNRIGIYEGQTKSGKARISLGSKVVVTNFGNLEISSEEREMKKVSFVDEESPKENTSDFKDEIDLHIEVLDPSFVDHIPQRILDRQIEMCRTFILKAIELRRYQVTIIHGIGVGLLRKEVAHLLGDFEEVNHTELMNNGGVTRVLLKY